MKHIKKNFYALILLLVVVSGLLFANCEFKNKTKPSQKTMSIAERKTRMDKERKKWEASPDGIKYKEWEVSPEGKKIHASHDKIKKYISNFTDMNAVVTSVTFRRENANPPAPKWLIVKIDGEEYMMQFMSKDFEPLKKLKVNDSIVIKSRSAGYSPNHPYLILSCDYLAQNNKILFKRDFSKNKGC